MFTWICPKCGKEVPPAYSECPNCAATPDDKPAAAVTAAPATATPVQAPAPPRQVRIPAWLVTIVGAVVFAGAGVGAFFLFRSSPESQTARSGAPTRLEQPSAPVQPIATQPGAAFKYVELTGLRLTEDAKQKAQLQFLIVNHSGADLGEIGAKVNLKSLTTGKDQQQQSVGEFSFKVSLGPYESKELKVPVTTNLRVYELPDWQFLRAEIAGQ